MLKSTQLPPTVASLLPPSPPSRHPQFTRRTEMLIRRHDSTCNINGTSHQNRGDSFHMTSYIYVQLDCWLLDVHALVQTDLYY